MTSLQADENDRTPDRCVACGATLGDMAEQISQRELRNDSGRIMRGLDEGRSYIITRRSEPVGELHPLRRRRYVDSRAVTEIFRGAPVVDWRTMRDELDRDAGQDLDPRA